MVPDLEGFLQPRIAGDLCISCGICENVCPVLNVNSARLPLRCYAAKSKDEVARLCSSSGGVFSIFAKNVLDQKGVVFGVGWSDVGCETMHISIETLDELELLRGSKYVQSDMNDCYRRVKRFLEDGRKILFTGCPCQIAGLKSFLQKEYCNLILQEVICNSVPSPRALRKFTKIEQEKVPEEKLLSVFFRDKKNGWHNTTLRYQFTTTTTTTSLGMSIYYKLWQKGFTVRRSCINCSFRDFKSGADLTIGDFWGIEKIIPTMDDNKGVSVVMVNTEKGKVLWESIRDKVESYDVLYSDVLRYNPCLHSSYSLLRSAGKKRDVFWQKVNDGVDILTLGSKMVGPSFLQRVRSSVGAVVRKMLSK